MKREPPGAPFGEGSGRAGDVEAVGTGFESPDSTAPNEVKRAVHIVIGLRYIGLFTKTGMTPLRLTDWFLYPDEGSEGFYSWDQLLQALQRHDEAGDEFAPVRLTGHAFKNPRSEAAAIDFMRAGLMVSNQTFMADDNDPEPRQHRKRRDREWLWILDGKQPGTAYRERAENYSRRIERSRRQWLLQKRVS